jgi:hypothetical protein
VAKSAPLDPCDFSQFFCRKQLSNSLICCQNVPHCGNQATADRRLFQQFSEPMSPRRGNSDAETDLVAPRKGL